jgi:hypothetical protein
VPKESQLFQPIGGVEASVVSDVFSVRDKTADCGPGKGCDPKNELPILPPNGIVSRRTKRDEIRFTIGSQN